MLQATKSCGGCGFPSFGRICQTCLAIGFPAASVEREVKTSGGLLGGGAITVTGGAGGSSYGAGGSVALAGGTVSSSTMGYAGPPGAAGSVMLFDQAQEIGAAASSVNYTRSVPTSASLRDDTKGLMASNSVLRNSVTNSSTLEPSAWRDTVDPFGVTKLSQYR